MGGRGGYVVKYRVDSVRLKLRGNGGKGVNMEDGGEGGDVVKYRVDGVRLKLRGKD